jgi:hypothetical protein
MPSSPLSPSLFTGTLAYATPPRFDPADGRAILEPPGKGYGYWAGAPSAVYDPEQDRFYTYYRLRSPRTMGRGGECGIAVSDNGEAFTSIWTARKADFDANSIEKGCLIRDPHTGRWRLYLSYEVGQSYDRNPATWRIDLIEADSPEAFDPLDARPVLDGSMFGHTFVKDPVVIVVGGEYHLFASVGFPAKPSEPDQNGVLRTRGRGWTALFRSHDGVNFARAKTVLEPPGQGWDAFQRRMTSVVFLPPVWVGFYDGATHRADSYDEFCGVATSFDLETWRCSAAPQPWVVSPYGTGSIRYLSALAVRDQMHYFYEYTRPDRGHELRHSVVPLG